MSWTQDLFHTSKPIIGLLHLDPLPSDPFYGGSMEDVIENARRNLMALQNGGIDGILITNEFSTPFYTETTRSAFGAMCRVFGELKPLIRVPYGVETIHDGEGCVEISAACDGQFTRCLFTGAWVDYTGLRQRDPARTLRLRRELRMDDLSLCYFVEGEGLTPMDGASLVNKAKAILGGCRPEMLVVAGPGPGRQPDVSALRDVKAIAGDTAVFCGTGCNLGNVEEILSVCDGAWVGTALKQDGKIHGMIDEERVRAFMDRVKAFRKDG